MWTVSVEELVGDVEGKLYRISFMQVREDGRWGVGVCGERIKCSLYF